LDILSLLTIPFSAAQSLEILEKPGG